METGAVAACLRRTRAPPDQCRTGMAEPYRFGVDATGRARHRSGPTLAARARPRCPFATRPTRRDYGGPWLYSPSSARQPPLALPHAAMRGLGSRSIPQGARTATRESAVGLTRHEREGLDLICEGHTNAGKTALLSCRPRERSGDQIGAVGRRDRLAPTLAAPYACRCVRAGLRRRGRPSHAASAKPTSTPTTTSRGSYPPRAHTQGTRFSWQGLNALLARETQAGTDWRITARCRRTSLRDTRGSRPSCPRVRVRSVSCRRTEPPDR